jgi:hypothetical protein
MRAAVIDPERTPATRRQCRARRGRRVLRLTSAVRTRSQVRADHPFDQVEPDLLGSAVGPVRQQRRQVGYDTAKSSETLSSADDLLEHGQVALRYLLGRPKGTEPFSAACYQAVAQRLVGVELLEGIHDLHRLGRVEE